MGSVLLIGNGINRSFSDKRIRVDSLLTSDKNPCPSPLDIPKGVYVPFPLKVVIQTQDQVDLLMKNSTSDLWGNVKTGSEQYRFYQKILELPCDDVLTTNYGFELEETSYETEIISKYKVNAITDFIKARGRNKAEPNKFMYTYQSAGEKYNDKRIWHIHGHAKNPSSMIIGHGYYGRMLHKIIEYVNSNEGRYRFGENEVLSVKSWVDAFLFSDVYVLGFSYDFAEMDLWWLLDQKKNGKYGRDAGKLWFYEPYHNSNWIKYEMMKSYGAEVRNLGVKLKKTNDDHTYKEFYLKAIEDIRKQMSKGE